MSTDWYYPRTDLVSFWLGGIEAGLLNRFAFFAPRQRGKTSFLTCDLKPAAERKGYFVVYIDLWKSKNDPESAFVEQVIDAITADNRVLQALSQRIKLKGELAVLGSKFSIETLAHQPQQANRSVAFKLLDQVSKPVLLLIDEAQTLARDDKQLDEFTAALRSFLVNRTNQDQVKAIFTGSSQAGLYRLFKRNKSPLFDAAKEQVFPELGADFVQYQLDVFRKATGGIILDQQTAERAFKALYLAPGRLVDLLQSMALYRVHDMETGFDRFAATVMEKEYQEYLSIVDELHLIDMAILQLIADGKGAGFYTEEGYRLIQEQASEPMKVNRGAVSNALKRLEGNSLIFSMESSGWVIDDPSFRDFLLKVKPAQKTTGSKSLFTLARALKQIDQD